MDDSYSGLAENTERCDTQALRVHTSSAHSAVERTLDLPGAITNLEDYRRWLTRFFGLYYPIEACLGKFHDWKEWEIPFEPFSRANNLSKDLAAMSVPVQNVKMASGSAIPRISNFGEALGALYVIEGSSLGGRFILLDLSKRLGQRIDGANSFFVGHGAQTGLRWNSFKNSLDHFLSREPMQFANVTIGAMATFAAFEAWMSIRQEEANPDRS